MTMSKKSMVLVTIMITSITLLFVYIDYAYAEYNRFQTYTLLSMCIINVFLVVSVVILQFENTKLEKWVYKKWDQIGYIKQEEIRIYVWILVFVAYIILIAIGIQSMIGWGS